MALTRLRAEFPLLERLAYLNAGTDGPVPERAVRAAATEVERQAADGRTLAHFEHTLELRARQRAAYAALLGCEPGDVALTTSTTEGLARVIAGIELRPGDEILTSDEEHPGLLGPLQAARDLRGATVRVAALADLPAAIGPRTRLVACSHVSWATGALAPGDLARAAGEAPVFLDGAQGAGAIPVDVRALGCAVYAAAGQKWLCGPDGTGMLYVAPQWRERIATTDRGYASFADPGRGLDAPLHDDARRYDTPALACEASAFALASHEALARAGWAAVHERAASLAAALAERLRERGLDVAPRGETTLVSWRVPDPPAAKAALAAAGVVVRDIPGTSFLRASVGAWNDESDLERLLAALPAA